MAKIPEHASVILEWRKDSALFDKGPISVPISLSENNVDAITCAAQLWAKYASILNEDRFADVFALSQHLGQSRVYLLEEREDKRSRLKLYSEELEKIGLSSTSDSLPVKKQKRASYLYQQLEDLDELLSSPSAWLSLVNFRLEIVRRVMLEYSLFGQVIPWGGAAIFEPKPLLRRKALVVMILLDSEALNDYQIDPVKNKAQMFAGVAVIEANLWGDKSDAGVQSDSISRYFRRFKPPIDPGSDIESWVKLAKEWSKSASVTNVCDDIKSLLAGTNQT